MWSARLLKYGIVTGVTLGTLASLKANQYNFDSIGVVRLGRAAVTVSNVDRLSCRKLLLSADCIMVPLHKHNCNMT